MQVVPEVSAVTGTQETCMQPTDDMHASQRGQFMAHLLLTVARDKLSGLRKAEVSNCLLGIFK